MTLRSYHEITRGAWHSFLFSLPLLVIYQLLVLLVNFGQSRTVINGADAIVQNIFSLVGVRGVVGTSIALIIVAGFVAYRIDAKNREGKPKLRLFWGVLAESSAYALVFGSLVSLLTALVLPFGGFLQIGGGMTFWQKLTTGIGAGLYEELVFRLLLMGGLVLLFNKLKLKPQHSVIAALLISSFLFSLIHYIGPLGDPFQLGSFTFRLIAGIVLAGLYAWRGFAVAAWTHSLYDVFLLFAGGG